jgi:TfuA protein
MKMIVFVGPSMAAEDRLAIRGAHFENPIRRGDLITFAEYELFVILDGEFGQSLSVSPKEILALLDAGKTVIGASSMGALRASELDSFGMIGVGWVYEHFSKAEVRRDDDVALCYSPFDLSPTTVPMVDIVYGLDILMEAGLISGKERNSVLRKSRAVFFSERSQKKVDTILETVFGSSRAEILRSSFGETFPSVKALDAKKALDLAFSIALERGAA